MFDITKARLLLGFDPQHSWRAEVAAGGSTAAG
jgi:hypothetical protein